MIMNSMRRLWWMSLSLIACDPVPDDGQGDDAATTDGSSTDSSSSTDTDTSEGLLCEDDPNAPCGPEPLELAVFVVPPIPMSDSQFPATYEFDCTITELAWVGADNTTIMADCGTGLPAYLGTGLPEATFAKLTLGQQVRATFTASADGNGGGMALHDANDALLFLVFHGTSVDPYPGENPFAPFAVNVEEDLCLAPCPTDDACYAWDRQRLDFEAEGVAAQIWQADEATMSVAGTDYLVTVTHAQGVETVAPESASCGTPAYPFYAFRIADVSAG